MNEWKDVIARIRRAEAQSPGVTGAHLDEHAVAAFVDGTLAGVERDTATAHLASCGACRLDVAELAAALNDDRVRAELVALEQAPHGGARRRGLGNGARVLMGAAAAAIIVAVTVPRMSRRDVPAYRDENGTAIAGPAIRHPSGPNSTSEFQWSSVPQAEQYRVTVFTDDGAIAWESTTADTTIALPARSPLESGRRYLWKVEARTGFDRWVGSRLVEFTLRDSVKR